MKSSLSRVKQNETCINRRFPTTEPFLLFCLFVFFTADGSYVLTSAQRLPLLDGKAHFSVSQSQSFTKILVPTCKMRRINDAVILGDSIVCCVCAFSSLLWITSFYSYCRSPYTAEYFLWSSPFRLGSSTPSLLASNTKQAPRNSQQK